MMRDKETRTQSGCSPTPTGTLRNTALFEHFTSASQGAALSCDHPYDDDNQTNRGNDDTTAPVESGIVGIVSEITKLIREAQRHRGEKN